MHYEWFEEETVLQVHMNAPIEVNVVAPVYETYAIDAVSAVAHALGAASQAAHDVATAAYPDQADRFACSTSR